MLPCHHKTNKMIYTWSAVIKFSPDYTDDTRGLPLTQSAVTFSLVDKKSSHNWMAKSFTSAGFTANGFAYNTQHAPILKSSRACKCN